MALKLNTKYLASFVGEDELTGIAPAVNACAKVLHDKTGLGNDFLGWLTLPTDYDKEEFARIQAAAKKIQSNSDILIVIGIGGSYLGARAAIEFLQSTFYNNKKKDTPDIYYVGNNINPSYLQEVLAICEGKDISVNVISKSGTTTEPALAFRVFKQLVEKKYGKDGAKDHIFATTDKAKGTLKSLSDTEGYETFVVPDDVGGRFSVLTAVGLLPIAVSGDLVHVFHRLNDTKHIAFFHMAAGFHKGFFTGRWGSVIHSNHRAFNHHPVLRRLFVMRFDRCHHRGGCRYGRRGSGRCKGRRGNRRFPLHPDGFALLHDFHPCQAIFFHNLRQRADCFHIHSAIPPSV